MLKRIRRGPKLRKGRSRRNGKRPAGVMLVAVLLLSVVVFFFAMGQIHAHFEAQRAASVSPSEIRTVILDPGHGGADGGAVGVNDTVEKDINLSISLKLRDMLVMQGYTVYMTRETDIMTCDEGLKGITKQKKSDMHNRLKLMEEHPEAIVLSIHQNLFEKEKYSGAQMFYGKNNPYSQTLAQSIQDAFVKNLQPDNSREIKKGEKDLYLLWQCKSPIVLVECGFLSNAQECAMLLDEEYQGKVAFTIMEGVMKGLNLADMKQKQ